MSIRNICKLGIFEIAFMQLCSLLFHKVQVRLRPHLVFINQAAADWLQPDL